MSAFKARSELLMHWPLAVTSAVLLLLIIAGGSAVAERAGKVSLDYLATRPLRANHLLRESDIVLDPSLPDAAAALAQDKQELAGRYLARDYQAGDPIRPGELQARPCIDPPAGLIAIAIPVGKDQSLARFEPGWLAEICGADSCPVKSAAVLALDCVDEDCSVIVAVSGDDATKVVSEKGNAPVVRSSKKIWRP